jgi:hypothetical protein
MGNQIQSGSGSTTLTVTISKKLVVKAVKDVGLLLLKFPKDRGEYLYLIFRLREIAEAIYVF